MAQLPFASKKVAFGPVYLKLGKNIRTMTQLANMNAIKCSAVLITSINR